MNFETIKWIYQRASSPLIFILFLWLIYKVYFISDYSYENINYFFKDYFNLFLFILLIFLSLFHASIEVFHSINDYFYKTKYEDFIKNLVKIIYLLLFLLVLIFIINLVL
tara:strand:+ start:130 stop:459 length:330 start_codon:yes stop_codon:yes gene_type:complete